MRRAAARSSLSGLPLFSAAVFPARGRPEPGEPVGYGCLLVRGLVHRLWPAGCGWFPCCKCSRWWSCRFLQKAESEAGPNGPTPLSRSRCRSVGAVHSAAGVFAGGETRRAEPPLRFWERRPRSLEPIRLSGAARRAAPVAAAPTVKAAGFGFSLPVGRFGQPARYSREVKMIVVVVDHLLDDVVALGVVALGVVVAVDADALPVQYALVGPVAAIGNVAENRRESLSPAPTLPTPLRRRGMTPPVAPVCSRQMRVNRLGWLADSANDSHAMSGSIDFAAGASHHTRDSPRPRKGDATANAAWRDGAGRSWPRRKRLANRRVCE